MLNLRLQMRKKGRVRIVGDEVSVADLADQRLAGCVRGVDQSDKNFDPPLVSGIVLAELGISSVQEQRSAL